MKISKSYINNNNNRINRTKSIFINIISNKVLVAFYFLIQNSSKLFFLKMYILRFILIFFVPGFLSSTWAASTDKYSSFNSINRNTSNICSSMKIANCVKSFKKLEQCDVIEGSLIITLIQTENASYFSNISFPRLTEITDYLVFFKVSGLRSIGQLFPNLSVIRGQNRMNNKALVIYEMPDLQEIDLFSLTEISQGQVYINQNPSLCFLRTIDWSQIVRDKSAKNVIISIKPDKECPTCMSSVGSGKDTKLCPMKTDFHGNAEYLCWNKNHCQKICPPGCNTCNNNLECCDDSCLACSDENPKLCKVCKYYNEADGLQKTCRSNCSQDLHEYMGRRCLERTHCLNMNVKILENSCVPVPTQGLTPPTNINVISNSSDSLLVTWQPPISIVPITHYIVSVEESIQIINYYTRNQNYCDVNNPITEEKTIEDIEKLNFENALVNEIYIKRRTRAISNNSKKLQNFTFHTLNTHYYIKNLHYYTLYDVSVKACRGINCKKDNNGYLYRTKGKDGADKVNILKVLITRKNVNISWEPPKEPNAAIFAYLIEYKRLDVDNAKSVVECVNLPSKTAGRFLYQIGNLTPGRYIIIVTSKSAFKKETSNPFYFSVPEEA